MQAAAVHPIATVDTLIRGVTASLPGGPKTSAVVVISIIVAVNVLLVLAMLKGFKAVGGVKTYLSDFPSQNAATGLSLILIFETGLVVLIRLALGLIFPDGYDTWVYALVGLAGVNVAGLSVKRLTDTGYVAAKAAGKAQSGPSVTVEGDATVNATAEHATTKATTKLADSTPFGGSSQ